MNNELLYHKFIFINHVFKRRNATNKDISPGQGRILAILNMKDAIPTKELSEILNIRVTSLNESLNKLAEKGYIKRDASPRDKRVLLIHLTDKGRKFKYAKPKDIDIFDCLSDVEKENLNEYLNLISKAFHKKLRQENPEKYEKMINHKKEVFEKYFDCNSETMEWFSLIEKN